MRPIRTPHDQVFAICDTQTSFSSRFQERKKRICMGKMINIDPTTSALMKKREHNDVLRMSEAKEGSPTH
jgi:hypothetical protein